MLVVTIIVMAITAAGSTMRATVRTATTLQGVPSNGDVVDRVIITIAMWWQIRLVASSGWRCTRFWRVCSLTKHLEIIGSLGTSAGL